jgi:hypothetical protein
MAETVLASLYNGENKFCSLRSSDYSLSAAAMLGAAPLAAAAAAVEDLLGRKFRV